MTQKEIVTALRSCEQHKKCEGACPLIAEFGCIEKAMGYAADLIENQQRHIDELLQANDALRDTIMRRDAKIEKMSEGLAQFAKAVAVEEEQSELHATKNELCQYCGKYKQAHEGACDGCRWREK